MADGGESQSQAEVGRPCQSWHGATSGLFTTEAAIMNEDNPSERVCVCVLSKDQSRLEVSIGRVFNANPPKMSLSQRIV